MENKSTKKTEMAFEIKFNRDVDGLWDVWYFETREEADANYQDLVTRGLDPAPVRWVQVAV
jgi:hypothetical protein